MNRRRDVAARLWRNVIDQAWCWTSQYDEKTDKVTKALKKKQCNICNEYKVLTDYYWKSDYYRGGEPAKSMKDLEGACIPCYDDRKNGGKKSRGPSHDYETKAPSILRLMK